MVIMIDLVMMICMMCTIVFDGHVLMIMNMMILKLLMNMFMNIIMQLEFYLVKISVQYLSVGLHQDLNLFIDKMIH